MNGEKTYFILNPASAGGKTGRNQRAIIQSIKKYFGHDYELVRTSEPLQATALSRAAVKHGFLKIVAIGGDGTVQEVVNGFFENGYMINPNCHLGIISCGTGCGLAQSLNLPTRLDEQLQIIKSGLKQCIDIGKISFTNGKSQPVIRYFVNELQAGIGGAVVKNLQTGRKFFGGFLAFGITTILTIFNHPNQTMTLELNDKKRIIKRFLGIMIGNGAYTGGGMKLTPQAQLNDRLLDVLVMHEQNVPQRLIAFSKIYSGKHINSQHFSYSQVEKIKMASKENVLIAADGELLGSLPCEVEIVPSVLQVCTKSNEVLS